jgi:protein kinase X
MRYPTPLSAKSSDSSRATKHPSRSPKANAAPSKGVHARKHALKASKTGRGSDYDPKPVCTPGGLPSHNMFTDCYLQPRIVVHGLPGYTGGLLPPDAVDPRPPTLPLDGFECIRTLGMTSLFQKHWELD